MSEVRVICIGNRFVKGDDLGPRVHDRLMERPNEWPNGLDVVDGGLRGLDLLPLLRGPRRVVFVDALSGFGAPGELWIRPVSEAPLAPTQRYGHGGGLGYLLGVLPSIWEGPQPELFLAGFEGEADEEDVDRLARACLALADGESALEERGAS